MKMYGLIILLISINLYGMENTLKDAISRGDEHEIKELLKTIPSQYTHLLDTPPNFDELHQYAAELAQRKEENAHTLNNRHVYQRSFAGLITIAAGGYAVVDYFMTGNFDQQKLAQILGGAAALYHGGNNLYLGFTNRDAHNESARHHAIVAHLKDAKQVPRSSI